jgi:hypothetical protein
LLDAPTIQHLSTESPTSVVDELADNWHMPKHSENEANNGVAHFLEHMAFKVLIIFELI